MHAVVMTLLHWLHISLEYLNYTICIIVCIYTDLNLAYTQGYNYVTG